MTGVPLWPGMAVVGRPAGVVRFVAAIGALLLAISPVAFGAGAVPTDEAARILHDLRRFATTGRVLHVGAHPDDENTQLIAYLSLKRAYDTAYLSITRGDGGQNLLGPDFDEKLGVARTQELLAARRIDGGIQFFTRAIDFGFSKTSEETLSFWDHREVLGDVVRVIRQFRPDIIVTRFPIPPGSGGHGHHTASAILAVEAFKLAGDPKAYPEQLKQGLQPWQPKRIVWNRSGFSRGGGIEKNPSVKVDIGGDDPVTGQALGAIAARSRSMHKTQGFGDFAGRASSGPRLETFVLLGGEQAATDFMDGIDTTWARVQGGAEIGRLADAAIAAFDPSHPGTTVPALLTIRQKLAGLPADPLLAGKRAELDSVLARCLGLTVASRTRVANVVPGDTVDFDASVRLAAAAPVPVRWIKVATGDGSEPLSVDGPVPQGEATRAMRYPVAADAPVSQPYWLREPAGEGIYRVDDPALIDRPENPPELPVTYTFAVGDQTLVVADQLTVAPARAGNGEPESAAAVHAVVITPPASIDFVSPVAVFRPGTTKDIAVEVTAERPNVSGTVALDHVDGWQVSAPVAFQLVHRGDKARLSFRATAPQEQKTVTLGAHVEVAGRDWNTSAIHIDYPHLPPLRLQPPAREKVVAVDAATRGHAIGYIPGAGDDVPEALRQLGYEVTMLAPDHVTPEALGGLDAVVIGVRAFNTDAALSAAMPVLFRYVEAGGTVVAQYNWPRNLTTTSLAPYRLTPSDRRVTDEHAAVTFLAPQNAVLNTPNRITSADFDGWVQERGVYFPTEWDEHFVPVLSMHDADEPPLQGALLVAPYGKGHYVYTSLALFRQLPAGVPGAYRLLANLVSLGR